MPGAAEDDLHAAADLADVATPGPDTLVGVVRFAGDLFAAGKDGLDVPQRDGGGSTFVALDDARDQLVHRGPSYSSNSASRSASRIFWIITCLAVWVPIRSAMSSGVRPCRCDAR